MSIVLPHPDLATPRLPAVAGAYTRGVETQRPRVAYFPDSFHEVNGVAHTSRQFEAYASRHGLPFLCVRAGDGQAESGSGSSVSRLELPRGFLSFALDKDLRYDPGFLRHLPSIVRTLRAFQPGLIHITGPSELGMIGALLAHHLQIPLVASWHTNVHEYLARRSHALLSILPPRRRQAGADAIERTTLAAAARFYSLARLLFAPNPALCRLLEQATHRPCVLMPRGVDAELFSPAHRTRPAADRQLVLGFVGRLSVEKNIGLLAAVHAQLIQAGLQARFLVVGQGVEEAWLRTHLPGAQFPGVLRGQALSEAYANMDCFVFPSHTDTFGNVVLEALASGVPAIVTPDGGPAHLVRDGVTGRVVADEDFGPAIAGLLRDPERLGRMRAAARLRALEFSWDAVFDGVYAAYAQVTSGNFLASK
jgi:glycosyltransferase involved in cell wall biosynthesis